MLKSDWCDNGVTLRDKRLNIATGREVLPSLRVFAVFISPFRYVLTDRSGSALSSYGGASKSAISPSIPSRPYWQVILNQLLEPLFLDIPGLRATFRVYIGRARSIVSLTPFLSGNWSFYGNLKPYTFALNWSWYRHATCVEVNSTRRFTPVTQTLLDH